MAADLDFLNAATWLNPPPESRRDTDGLAIATAAETDFWRDTFYGFRHDNGHFLGAPIDGDFTATVTFEGGYEALYDQAGLMLRVDETTWLKAGIELSDGMTNFSTVVTRDRSDWSVIGVPLVSGPQTLRLTRIAGAVVLHYRDSAGVWQLMRVADFPQGGAARLGVMACSPKRAGFQARFTAFTVGPAIASPLHASD